MERFKQWMIDYTAPAVPRSPALRAATAAVLIIVPGAWVVFLAYCVVLRRVYAG
jgi:hypothetical protein